MEAFPYDSVNNPDSCLQQDDLVNWISFKNNFFSINQCKVKVALPKVNEFKVFLKTTMQLQKLFKETLTSYINCNVESEKLTAKVKLKEIREQMDIFNEILNNDSYIKLVSSKLEKIKKRRNYICRKKQKFAINQLTKECEIQTLERKTDKWLLSKREEESNRKLEKLQKYNTKLVLSDVVKRINQVKDKIELIESAIKLRHLKEKDENQNESKSDEFDNEMCSIKNLLVSKMNEYECEKKKLVEQMRTIGDQAKNMNSKRHILSVRDSVTKLLFGNESVIDINSKRDLFYKQSMLDFNDFLMIRSQWDSFIVNKVDAGSYLPVTWVLPTSPNDLTWQPFLE